jgi:hypothetical protein
MIIEGPADGITLSGKDQHRVIYAERPSTLRAVSV